MERKGAPTKLPLKICMVYNYDYCNPRHGGGIRYVHNLINYLSKRGINIELWGVELGKCPHKSEKVDLVKIVSGTDSALAFFIGLFIKALSRRPRFPEIVHAHRTYFLLPFIIARSSSIKVVTLHMKPYEFLRKEHPILYKILKIPLRYMDDFILRRVNVAVAITKEVLNSYAADHPSLVRDKKLILIEGSGLDLNLFKHIRRLGVDFRRRMGIPYDAKVLLFAGRLSKIKNIPLLLKSFEILAKKDERYLLLIAGEGPERKTIELLSKELGLEDRILILGFVPPDSMPSLYNASDVTVLPSLSEASPNVIRESLACGTPVVATRVGDAPKIIARGVGYLANMDPRDLAEKIERILNLEDAEFRSLRERCREVAIEMFDLDKIINQYEELYLSLLNPSGKSQTHP